MISKTSLAPAVLPARNAEDVVFVVDISGYIFRAYHALPPMSSSKGEPTHAVRGVTSMLLELMERFEPTMICVAIDSRSSIRKAQFEGYKATRPPAPPDLASQIDRVYQVVDALQLQRFGLDGYEADDVIASVVSFARSQGKRVVIASADKDLLQLVGDDVVMFDSMRNKVFGPAETVEKFGVEPALVRDLLALTGDTSDNVPGVPSVGPKTAAGLLNQHGSVDGIFAAIDKVKGKVREKLIEHRDAAYLSRDLVSLHANLSLGLTVESLRRRTPDGASLRQVFTELEFTRLLKDIAKDIPGDAVQSREPVEVSIAIASSRDAILQLLRSAMESGALTIETVLSTSDPLRAQCVGIALAVEDEKALYIPVGHRLIGANNVVSEAELVGLLAPVLSNALLRKSTSDAKREISFWAGRDIPLRGVYFDAALASYVLDPGVRDHSVQALVASEFGTELEDMSAALKAQRLKNSDELEVEVASRVVGKQAAFVQQLSRVLMERLSAPSNLGRLLSGLELPLADVLAGMERTGVLIDKALLHDLSHEAEVEISSLEKRAFELVGRSFNLGSPKQLETILFDELKLAAPKKTKTGRSTDASVLEELTDLHPLAGIVLEHRAMAKLKGTYLDALPLVADEEGRVHTRYNQYVAATGRLSSSDPNLQNIPIRTNFGRRIREAFVAPAGSVLVSADYSQIELRVLAHLSGDDELIDAFSKNDDVHKRTATALFGVETESVTRDMRAAAKTVNFAVIYGQTQWALARNLGISRTDAKRYIDAFFARYAGVTRFLNECVEEARTTGFVTTMFGRRRSIPDIRSKNPALRHGAERIAQNTPVQGSAADIMKRAMVDLDTALRAEGLRARMILTVHDEIVLEVPEHELDVVRSLTVRVMETSTKLSVPLLVETGAGKNWGLAHS